MRLRLARLILFFAACLSFGHAQILATQIPVVGNLSGISSSSNDLLQVRFTLANCGTANPVVPGVSTIVPKTKVFTADKNGNISDVLWGNDAIACNLGLTTIYQVQFLRNNVPTGVVAQYRVVAPVAPATNWNLTTAVPVSTLPLVNMPASGFVCPTNQPAMVGLLTDWTPVCAQLLAGSITAVSTAPVASQTVIQPAGTTLSVDSLNNVLSANAQVGGFTLGDKLAIADARLGSTPGIITIDAPGVIPGNLTLSPNHAIYNKSQVQVAGQISLSLGTSFVCSASASITLTGTQGSLFLQSGTNSVAIRDCVIHGSPATPNSYVLSTLGTVAHTALTHNIVDGMGLINTQPGVAMTDLLLSDNSATYAANGPQNAVGAYIFYVVGARIHNNLFVRTFHGVQWWGGDAGTFALSTGLAGKMTIDGNRCIQMSQACIWGSMGTDISVVGNQSDTNGDVAFDTEGGVRNSFLGNIAINCGNGCYAWFFSLQDITFDGNIAQGDVGTAFFGRNASVDPTKQNGLSIRANTITCIVFCNAILFDAVSSLHFDSNTITNARVLPTSYCGVLCSFRRNDFTLNLVLPNAASMISAPGMLNNGTLTIEGNDLRSTVGQSAAVTAIAALNNDSNTSDYGFINGNTIWQFPFGISTSSNSSNPGVHTFWKLDGNTISAGTPIVHSATNPNETYRVTATNKDYTGAPLTSAINEDQVAVMQTATTAATIGAQVTTTLTFANPPSGSFIANCSVYATAGVPGIVNYSNFSGKTIQVTIQATTAAPASGIVVCKQQSTT